MNRLIKYPFAMKYSKLKRLAAAALLAAAPAVSRAQIATADQILSEVNTKIKNTGAKTADVVAGAIGVAALFLILIAFIESNKSQNNSKDALIRIGVTLLVCAVAIEIIKAVAF